MGTKTISIMDDAYSLLVKRKLKNESFSEVIRRMADGKKDIMRFAGAWKDVPKESITTMKKTLKSLRKKSTLELLKKLEER